MNNFTLSGAVKKIGSVESFKNNFRKQDFIVTISDGKYPQDIKLEVIKDNISKLSNISVGDNVDVKFNLRGSEYNGKFYTNLQAWDISVNEDGEITSSSQSSSSQPVEA